ncbi:MAG: RNA polymerase sigma factor, partial [Candidatus Acidiferrales bacterium]
QERCQEKYLTRPDSPPPAGVQPDVESQRGARSVSEATLAEACRRGSLEAYEQLYQAHGAKMKSIARQQLGTAHDAEDVVQEVFLKIHRSIENFRGQSAFSTWIYRILLNACYDVRRRRMRHPETPEEELAGPDGTFDLPAPRPDHPLRMALDRCVARLSDDHREVFLLFEVEGFSHAEIGEMIGISEAASKNRLYQAKVQLRQWLTEPGMPKASGPA